MPPDLLCLCKRHCYYFYFTNRRELEFLCLYWVGGAGRTRILVQMLFAWKNIILYHKNWILLKIIRPPAVCTMPRACPKYDDDYFQEKKFGKQHIGKMPGRGQVPQPWADSCEWGCKLVKASGKWRRSLLEVLIYQAPPSSVAYLGHMLAALPVYSMQCYLSTTHTLYYPLLYLISS